jgi:competence protein ComEC
MRKSYHIFIWKKAPFLRLLIPVLLGIIVQFYFKTEIGVICFSTVTFFAAYIIFSFLPEAIRFRFRLIQGLIIFLFLTAFGSLITWQKDVRNHRNWYGKYDQKHSFIVATIDEPPVEKPKTFKAIAVAETVINNGKQHRTSGRFLIYFIKDSASQKLKYGDKIILPAKELLAIKNSGNPGAFDYAEYSAFQQIFQQAYLRKDQWKLLKEKNGSLYRNIVFETRDYILKTLQRYFDGADESSLAKALLIGYRLDLDKDLVQAYSNVGVVHLIAISGMHLALIYYFLVWLFAKIPIIKKSKLTRLIIVLACLWFFSLLTGAPASVLRSAVMFTFIAIGDSFNKKAFIYNSLAVSAFLLLCYDPFLLWDVGFQLSYLAVSGIVIFQKYIYNWVSFKNKFFDEAWKLASVSLAAQLLTLPVCIYYFHQFPLLFLLSNIIAIPLSTIILWACIAIVILSPISFAALYLGKLAWAAIWLLNHFIVLIDSIPFSLWSGLSLTIAATIVLYLILILFSFAFIKKNKTSFKLALVFVVIFTGMSVYKNFQLMSQKKMIVYNIPMIKAVDFIAGNKYSFIADPVFDENRLLYDYNIKPARIFFMAGRQSALPAVLTKKNNFYQFYNNTILMVDKALTHLSTAQKVDLDYIIFSKNARVNLAQIASVFNCKKYIFDASNSSWKIEQWKKECEELHLQFHSVPEQGAFVINL